MKTNWPIKKLGEVATIRMGETLIKKDLTNDGMPVYSADSTEIPWGFTSHNKLRFNHGSLVVGARGTIGSIKLPKDNFFTATQTTIVITPDSTIFPKFLYFVLQFQDFRDITSGVGIPMITVRSLWNLKIPLPPIAEQKRIVKKIEKLFAKIDEANRLRVESFAASAALLPSVLYQVFSRAEKEKWPTKKLGEIAKVFAGSSAPQATKYFENGRHPFIRVSDLNGSKIKNLIRSRDQVNDLAVQELRLTRAKRGSILFPKSGAAILTNSRAVLGIDAYIVGHLAVIEADESQVLFNYLFIFLSNFDMRELVSDPAYPSLRLSDVKELKIPLPPISEQKKIVAYLDAFFAKTLELQNLQTQTATDFSALRQSVLAKAFK